jgi:short subunit dehydrogenase-like uncharacterized protein
VSPWLVYGATGYTGRLVVEEARRRDLSPIVAGRSAEKVRAVAEPAGLEWGAVALDDGPGLRRALEGVACVLHVAGPFSATARPMLEACLDTRTHYLDVTGEIDVFERAASLDARARAAGVMLLPGTGFDVVPSDCLAAHVAARAPGAHRLRLAIAGLGGASRGTTRTMVEALGEGTRVRRGGRIVSVPAGSLVRDFDFGAGPRRCIAVSWGDVATAFHSTGIPDVETYFAAAGPIEGMSRASRLLGPLLRSRPVQALLTGLVDRLPEGPTPEQRERSPAVLVAEVETAEGRRVASRLTTPNGYTLTARAAVEIAVRVVAGAAKSGFQTPSRAFGADFVLALPGCARIDLA